MCLILDLFLGQEAATSEHAADASMATSFLFLPPENSPSTVAALTKERALVRYFYRNPLLPTTSSAQPAM